MHVNLIGVYITVEENNDSQFTENYISVQIKQKSRLFDNWKRSKCKNKQFSYTERFRNMWEKLHEITEKY
jgi:hypothetical protein